MIKDQNLLGGKKVIHKAFRYRLQPDKKQEKQFRQFAGCCRFVYNWGLAKWGELYAQEKTVSVFTLSNELVLLKKDIEHTWLNNCSAQALQQSLANLGIAFKNFFEKRSAYPQFKKKGNRDSFRFMQYFEVLEKYIKLPILGNVKYRKDRNPEGKVKSVVISNSGGHWFASVVCEVELEEEYNNTKSCVGIDVGVKYLATVFDGLKTAHYSHDLNLQVQTNKLRKFHQKLSRKQKGSKNRNKAYLKLLRQYELVANIRRDRIHKLTTNLCKNHAAIAVEDLSIRNMTKARTGTGGAQKRGLNRSIRQQGWGDLFRQLLYKTKWYGSLFVIVDARRTSQTCPECGFIARENRLTQSAFKCLDCGYSQNADIVAAMNVRRRGMSCFGQ